MTPAPDLGELIRTVHDDAGGGADDLALLVTAVTTVHEMEETGDAVLGHFVDQCRRQGRSWSEISSALGVTKQAAHKRFSGFGGPTFERFTPRAQAVLVAARRFAAPGDGVVGADHLLAALYTQPEGLAARALTRLGLDARGATAAIGDPAGGVAAEPVSAEDLGAEIDGIQFSPEARTVLRTTLGEALALQHNYIGTEHLLLGLLAADGPTGRWLAGAGISHDGVLAVIQEYLAGCRAGGGR